MATPINTFKTVTANLTTNTETLYISPPITSTIILMAQITNVGSTTEEVTAYHYDGSSISTELVKEFPVPVNDAVGVLTGKLILMPGQSFTASASANSSLKITLSLLETR
jgi:hypothetical protein